MQAANEGLEGLAAQSLRELESNSGLRKEKEADFDQEGPDFGRPTKLAKTGGEQSRAGLRHIATEQRRRDRINDGFAQLKELVPTQDKADKATFLMNVVDYVKQIQGVMLQLLSMGALSALSEDVQWKVRMMLLRKNELPVAPATTAPAAVAGSNAATTALLAALLKANQPAQVQSGIDIGQLQMLVQATVAQQVQAQQSVQNQVLQAIQMQQLLQAMNQAPGSTVPAPEMTALPTSGASAFGPFVAPAGQAPTAPSVTAVAAGGCGDGGVAATQLLHGSAAPKPARKGAKVRRHTTAAKIGKPAPADEVSLMMDIGRPTLTEVGN